MNTYAYNIAGEVRYVRAVDKGLAFLKVFHGELRRVGKCSIKVGDLKMVRNPHTLNEKRQTRNGNRVFNGLRHL